MKTQAEKTKYVFELLDQMHKAKVKYLTNIALQHPKRDDLKTLFRKYDDEK
jgi:hypothetical protein